MSLRVAPARAEVVRQGGQEKTGRPTLLRVLLRQRGWESWPIFREVFIAAARQAADDLGDERLRGVETTSSTLNRWLSGSSMPQGAFRTVLEVMTGVGVDQLFLPAPSREVVLPRPTQLSSQTAALALDARSEWSSLFPTPPAPGTDGVWRLDASRVFEGTVMAVQLYEAARSGELAIVASEDTEHLAQFVRPSRRGLVLAALSRGGRATLHALDTVHARRQMADGSPWPTVSVPVAYELDDLTCAILWATVCLDDALLADDHLLTDAEDELAPHLSGRRSAVATGAVGDLSRSAAAWVGGWGCARFLTGRLEGTAGTAQWWAAVRGGEDAAMRLLVRHQTALAQALQPRVEAIGTYLGGPVLSAPRHERIWLFLLVAWWESQGLPVWLSTQDECAGLPGVLLVPDRRAVLTEWGGHDVLWRTDVTEERADVHAWGDTLQHAREHSANGESMPERLRALADLLDIDWAWMTRRCRDLGRYGTVGLLRPRSRHLSLRALDTALRAIGALAPP
ncbi:hypothetical protein ACFWNG_33790 [Streptomyces sp. NPDC058391]|uniref:hypothetical protein n=1 Tax=Streptomyces sp. NPDC058391 TaxID=3346476 RepID=UPI00364B8805